MDNLQPPEYKLLTTEQLEKVYVSSHVLITTVLYMYVVMPGHGRHGLCRPYTKYFFWIVSRMTLYIY